MAEQFPLRVQLLSVPDCPLVEKVRSTLESCLTKAQIATVLEEVVGDYSSPTLLVDGFDVTGYPPPSDSQISCRLDLPNEEQVLAALRVLTVTTRGNALEEQIRAAAFRSLVNTGQRVAVDALAAIIKVESGTIRDRVEKIHQGGHLQLDSEGFIVGAVGLSISPTRHEISIDGRRFCTWCALDVLGVFGALNASGFVKSSEPSSNNAITVEFVKGIPINPDVVVFLADLSTDTSVRCDWCPKVNFFSSRSSAESWVQANAANGSIVSVDHLAPVAREAWSRLITAQIAP
ncbi:hypothetical protein EIK77_002489 [Talaromyces pinophilus]|nr:hypothetical protein EIK77_002489 [Talaromyces pinophilus]